MRVLALLLALGAMPAAQQGDGFAVVVCVLMMLAVLGPRTH